MRTIIGICMILLMMHLTFAFPEDDASTQAIQALEAHNIYRNWEGQDPLILETRYLENGGFEFLIWFLAHERITIGKDHYQWCYCYHTASIVVRDGRIRLLAIDHKLY